MSKVFGSILFKSSTFTHLLISLQLFLTSRTLTTDEQVESDTVSVHSFIIKFCQGLREMNWSSKENLKIDSFAVLIL